MGQRIETTSGASDAGLPRRGGQVFKWDKHSGLSAASPMPNQRGAAQ